MYRESYLLKWKHLIEESLQPFQSLVRRFLLSSLWTNSCTAKNIQMAPLLQYILFYGIVYFQHFTKWNLECLFKTLTCSLLGVLAQVTWRLTMGAMNPASHHLSMRGRCKWGGGEGRKKSVKGKREGRTCYKGRCFCIPPTNSQLIR